MFYPQFHLKNISLYNVFLNHLSNFSRKKKANSELLYFQLSTNSLKSNATIEYKFDKE